MSESPYAAKLRELGFTPFTLSEVMKKAGITAIVANGEPLKDKPLKPPNLDGKLMSAEDEPSFAIVLAGEGVDPRFTMTMAYDETGQTWMKRGEAIDLSPYGFISLLQPHTEH